MQYYVSEKINYQGRDGEKTSATTATLYYENQFNTEILFAKNTFSLLKLVISNIKKLSVIWRKQNMLQWDFTVNANCAVML
jgi:hypothetical protein